MSDKITVSLDEVNSPTAGQEAKSEYGDIPRESVNIEPSVNQKDELHSEKQAGSKSYTSGIIWIIIGVGLLIWSHSGAETHLIIRGTDHIINGGISFGWLGIIYGIYDLIKTSIN